MDEAQYHNTYNELNPTRCYFEKLLLLRYGSCVKASKLLLAEREAYACASKQAQQRCLSLLQQLRLNARFVLQIPQTDTALPHAKEIRVQAGGLFGLQQLLAQQSLTQTQALHDDALKYTIDSASPIDNIYTIIEQAIIQYEHLDALPYNEIVKAIKHFQAPARKRKAPKPTN